MRVTIDEAAAIYTRACVAWYGTKALRIVRQQVQVMQKRGDKSGVEALRSPSRSNTCRPLPMRSLLR